mgnify:CR=1 FL=1
MNYSVIYKPGKLRPDTSPSVHYPFTKNDRHDGARNKLQSVFLSALSGFGNAVLLLVLWLQMEEHQGRHVVVCLLLFRLWTGLWWPLVRVSCILLPRIEERSNKRPTASSMLHLSTQPSRNVSCALSRGVRHRILRHPTLFVRRRLCTHATRRYHQVSTRVCALS